MDDVSARAPVPGRQFMTCGDARGTIIPFAVLDGLPHMDCHKPTIEEMADESIPTVVLTLDTWTPSALSTENVKLAVFGR